MNYDEICPKLEAVLFAVGAPIEISKISQIFEVSEEELLCIYENLKKKLISRNSGLCVIKLDGKLQICTKSEHAEEIRKALETKKNAPLSNAAFEVLAVVAYNQPVTKSFVEQVRGVDCSGVISTLLQKSLIEEKGRLDLPGRPLLYGTTDDFLRCFGISSLDELPSLPEEESEQVTLEEAIGEAEKEKIENINEHLSQKVDEIENLL